MRRAVAAVDLPTTTSSSRRPIPARFQRATSSTFQPGTESTSRCLNRTKTQDLDLFKGITGLSDIYLSSCFGYQESGYTSFEVDITDLVRFGEKVDNVIALCQSDFIRDLVRGRRNLQERLVGQDGSCRPICGVMFITKKIAGNEWDVPLEVTVRNDGDSAADVKVTGRILSLAAKKSVLSMLLAVRLRTMTSRHLLAVPS